MSDDLKVIDSFFKAIYVTIDRFSKQMKKEKINEEEMENISKMTLRIFFYNDVINVFSRYDGSRDYVISKSKGELYNEMQKDLELYTNVSDLIIDSFATYVSNCWCKMNLDISKKTTF